MISLILLKLFTFSQILQGVPKLSHATVENFMITNKNSASSGIIWEAMKAFLRGQIINYSSSKKKQYKKQSHKTPGLDGFSMDFYKKNFFKLADPLLSMYMEAIHKKELPETLNQALITVLLKPGKDPNLCTSYRPISLLNSDYKILTKMIALRYGD